MKSAFAKFYQSGASPGEELRRLAGFLESKRGDGLLIFCPERMNDPAMLEELHRQHVEKIRQLARIEEAAANGQ